MTEPSNVPIKSITYTHKDVECVFLDRLLGRRTPLSALAGPASQQQVLGSLATLPIELLLMVLENLAVTDMMRPGAATDSQCTSLIQNRLFAFAYNLHQTPSWE
ncbi:hypothetical protein GT037_006477 [Alternaria burnsii]|uniref:F-box domain-containing protein n=1 Tax=Alternaria burnsii TaxID=1187904 RepID=A0A8H7BAN4_9PLEO|nr:uncharacterized protein GT037_006477 [Alternaria burnsii]KAF7675758.1 hypothetical protein GT037_006477 [Alternaria burnsii]CAI9626413.1 unnamed protein product [Alternaria burnsii]